jgi:hypothetical protein
VYKNVWDVLEGGRAGLKFEMRGFAANKTSSKQNWQQTNCALTLGAGYYECEVEREQLEKVKEILRK